MSSSICNQIFVGIDKVDSDHTRIIKLINTLEQMIDDRADLSLIMYILSIIIGEFEQHFENEARIMSTAKYECRDEHVSVHGVLFEKLTKFVYLLETGDKGVDKVILDFLHSWMSHHVVEHDMKFANSLSG